MVMGVARAAAAGFQQAAMAYTTAGNAAFITGLYLVLVPLAGAFRGRRVGAATVVGIAAALAGLYLISVTESFRLRPGDGLVMACAVGFAVQILMVDHYAPRLSALRFSVTGFFTCAAISAMAALVADAEPFAGFHLALVPIAYSGFLAVAVAYTLQVVAQRDALATHAALIMSSESVFGALGGALLLGENMGVRGYSGAALMLAGVLISQLNAATRTTAAPSAASPSPGPPGPTSP
jgi:drug/metabolite transporter (DMT)-like permease